MSKSTFKKSGAKNLDITKNKYTFKKGITKNKILIFALLFLKVD